jgi:hypothetical protein
MRPILPFSSVWNGVPNSGGASHPPGTGSPGSMGGGVVTRNMGECGTMNRSALYGSNGKWCNSSTFSLSTDKISSSKRFQGGILSVKVRIGDTPPELPCTERERSNRIRSCPWRLAHAVRWRSVNLGTSQVGPVDIRSKKRASRNSGGLAIVSLVSPGTMAKVRKNQGRFAP